MVEQLPVLKKEKKKKSNTSRKLLFILLLLFVIILGVLFFRSSFSKISEVQISGNQLVQMDQILTASKLHVGDQFFGTSKGTIRDRILTNRAIEDVEVHLKFPGVIDIQVKEFPTVAYQISAANKQILGVMESGLTIPLKDNHIFIEKPILTQWKEKDPLLTKLCKQLGAIPNKLLMDISEILPDPSASYPDRIKMYTRSQFEVITTISLLKDKVEYLSNVIETQQPGVITMLNADSYRSFDSLGLGGLETEKETTQ